MTLAMNILPVTAAVAISLFIIKELLEAVRRWRGDKRKLHAIRVALARECELNLWTARSLKRAMEEGLEAFGEEPTGTLTIMRRASGRDQWTRHSTRKNLTSGGALPPVRSKVMSASVLPVAELDKKLFEALEVGLEVVAELEHLRGTLIDASDGSDPIEAMLIDGFLEWGLEQFGYIESGLNKLYIACTGRKLEKARLR